MRKTISLSLVMCLIVVILISNMSIPALATTKYGFTYDKSEYNASWKSMQSYNVYSECGGKLGTCSYVVGLTREKGTNNYVLMTREIMTPGDSKVKINKQQYGYGLSEFVSAKVTLKSLDDYDPQNTPEKDTVSFSVGADKSGPSISASYDITHSDIDITASCNTPKKIFHIKYDYKPSIVNTIANNKYVANESVQLGAAAFHTKGKVSFTMKYDARFGAASNNAASPWLIYINYVEKATDSREYTFDIKKN